MNTLTHYFYVKLWLSLSTLLLTLSVSSCSGSNDEEMSEVISEEEMDSNANSLDNAFSNNENNYFASNQDYYGDTESDSSNSYSMDSNASYDESTSYMDESTDSSLGSQVSGGQVFFVQNDTEVFNSPQGGAVVFSLAQGDSIKGEPMGEYTLIGVGQYVMTSSLSESVVARMMTANPWR